MYVEKKNVNKTSVTERVFKFDPSYNAIKLSIATLRISTSFENDSTYLKFPCMIQIRFSNSMAIRLYRYLGIITLMI